MKWYQEIIVLNKEIDGSVFHCFDEENYKKISDEREEQLREIERLNNIINELEEYMIDKDIYKILLYKLRDLKESDKIE